MQKSTVSELGVRHNPRFRTLSDEMLLRRHQRYGAFSHRVLDGHRAGLTRSISHAITLISRTAVRMDQVARELLRRYPQ